MDYNLIKSKKTTSDYDPITSYFTYPRGDGHYLPNPETEVMINGNTIVSAKRTEYDANTRLPLCTYELSEVTDTLNLISNSPKTLPSQIKAISEKTFELLLSGKLF